MKKIISLFFLLFYYCFAQYLPSSYLPFLGKHFNWLRKFCCKKLFKTFGNVATINRKSYFGNGTDIEIGDNSGLGMNFSVEQTILTIKENVMIAPNVNIIGGGA